MNVVPFGTTLTTTGACAAGAARLPFARRERSRRHPNAATVVTMPDDASIEELEREYQRTQRQGMTLWEDIERLRAELAKRKKAKK